MSNIDDDHVLCNDERSLEDAIDAIKLCSEVILDCEGQDLGQEGGSLSLISFRTIGPEAEVSTTYLIDVLSLTNDTLRPVFDIIQSSSPTKIVFDGRMDYSELFHGHGIPIRSVLDLQLADICSRRLRGEDEEDQLNRLSPYLKRGEVDGNSQCYTQVQKLCSLQQSLLEHEVDTGVQSGNRIQVTHSSWLQRPLPDEYVRYAVRDVYFIGLLYTHFKNKDYFTEPLSAPSDRYVAIWQDAKPKKADQYRSHALLPLQILNYTSYSSVRSCICCKRNLPPAAYSTNAWGKAKQRRCWVCRAIYLKVKVHARSYYGSDSDDYERYDSDNYGFGTGYYGRGAYDSDYDNYFSDGCGSNNYDYGSS